MFSFLLLFTLEAATLLDFSFSINLLSEVCCAVLYFSLEPSCNNYPWSLAELTSFSGKICPRGRVVTLKGPKQSCCCASSDCGIPLFLTNTIPFHRSHNTSIQKGVLAVRSHGIPQSHKCHSSERKGFSSRSVTTLFLLGVGEFHSKTITVLLHSALLLWVKSITTWLWWIYHTTPHKPHTRKFIWRGKNQEAGCLYSGKQQQPTAQNAELI